MRIAMVSEHASPLAVLGGADAGGQNVHVAALAVGLAKRGHEVRVYTRRDDPALATRIRLADGVEVVQVDAGPPEPIPKDELLPHMPALSVGIAEDWTGWSPDLAHSHFWMSGVATLAAVSRTVVPPPVVHTFHALGVVKRRHQGAQDTSPVERAWLEPGVGRGADGIIATCSDEAFELLQLGVPAARIAVIPCGVDLRLFTPTGPREERRRTYRVLSVGRLVPRKGVGTVVEAIARLAREGLDVELIVVGGGATESGGDPELDRLAQIVARCDAEEHVELRGQVPQAQLPEIYRSADLVVCAPWYEPFGIVPLEAMACGIPVVASSVGGLIDTVVDDVTGLHVRPRDLPGLASTMRALLEEPEERERMGVLGRRRVVRRYSWDRVAADTERAYRAVMARHRGSIDVLGVREAER